jgi:hypothetical protein
MARILALAGCACLLVVVLAHIAERWHRFPVMGWGLPHSPGHYLDLFSAIAGIALLLAAGLISRWPRNRAVRRVKRSGPHEDR